jgi:hypothetical protein
VRSLAPTLALVLVLVTFSTVLAAVAATFALAREDVGHLNADLSSRIQADYGAASASLAPLDQRIFEAARLDESSLQALAGGVELVQTFRVNDPEPFVAIVNPDPTDDPTTGSPTGGAATPTPAGGGPPGTTPPAGPGSPPPGQPPLPPGEVPLPTPTPPHTSDPPGSPSPTANPPTPTPTPGSTITPTPTPTPAPPAPTNLILYLHNNPSPPTGNTISQATLPMNQTAPTTSTLYNYDTDRDSAPGRVIQKGGTGPGEANPDKMQVWRTQPFASDVTFKNSIQIKIWSAMKDFAPNKRGTVSVYLHDFDGSTYTLIGTAGLDVGNWQGGNASWVLRQFTISNSAYTLRAGHSLDFRIIVKSPSADDMWFAYDTTGCPAQIIIQRN